ncbi:MAG: hypothetical protein LBG16_03980 [Elusimicrobiota bacterium]|jgi:hypothetical protein|nr:hypothetical protein [Elusimicrobiota bacterium]
MKATTLNQYSVFLTNEAGTLHKFAEMLYREGLDIVGFSSEVRYEAMVVKFIIEPLAPDFDMSSVSRLITKAGYTSVKTEVICIEEEGRDGFIMTVGEILGKAGINITSVYGSCVGNKHGRVYLVVDHINRALQLINNAPRRAA